jgi:hypothetical protein
LLANLGLQAMAALVLAFALLSFEVASYFVLVQVWSASVAAAVLGLCNLVLAFLLMLAASRRPGSRELALAKEVQQDALAALAAEFEHAEAAAPTSVRMALESAVFPLILPLVPLVLQRFRKHRGNDASPDAT